VTSIKAGEAMGQRRVVVLMNGQLLMAGVLAMLEEQTNMSVCGVSTEDDDLMLQLSGLEPMVIVVDGEDAAFGARYPLESLLGDHLGLTVVCLAQKESQIRAYRQQSVVGASVAGLLGEIDAAVPWTEARGEEWQ
jgi:hypothetical protein